MAGHSTLRRNGRAEKIRGDYAPEEISQLKAIGGTIIKVRNEMNVSTKDMATYLNITEQAYIDIEQGIRRLSIYKLSIVARVLGQPMAYFLGKNPKKSGIRTDSFEFLTPDTMELSRNFCNIENIALAATIKLLVQILAEMPTLVPKMENNS